MSETPIEKLYSDPKAKKFVNHLIGAYLPINKAQKAWELEKDQKPKCSVCGKKLITLGEALGLLYANHKEIMADTMAKIRKELDGQEITKEDNALNKNIFRDRVLAWTGENTNTLLCADCIGDLLNMVQTGMLTGDKNLVWKVNNMRRKAIFNHFSENPHLDEQEKQTVKDIEKRVEASKEKKITIFGDLEVLQKLKAKMESEDGK